MIENFDELISKHVSGKLSEEERLSLATLLKNPECQLFLASKIDGDLPEVQLFADVDEMIGDQILRELKIKIQESKLAEKEVSYENVIPINSDKKKIYRVIAVAASVTLIIISVLFWNNGKEKAVVKSNEPLQLRGEQHEVNHTGNEKRIQLSDSSLVILADNSELVYNEPFRDNRSIRLTGKAYFKVFKDQAHPFTVISGEISTTALGTEFTITAYKDTKQIVVRLYEGKVVVKPLDMASTKMKKEVYLLPGQQFVYGKDNASRNKSYKKGSLPEQVMNEEKFLDDPNIPENEKGSWYMFNNQLLSQTLDQLSALYNVRIVYNKEDVSNVYFTGKYERSESLETILKRIGTINNLKVVKNDTAFIITK